MEAHDDKGPCSCDMGGEALERFEVFGRIHVYTDIDGRRLGPFEVRDCAVDIVVGLEPETAPQRWIGCQGRTPVLTNVCGGDKIPLAGVIFENLRQDLWWKFVDGNIRVPDRPSRL